MSSVTDNGGGNFTPEDLRILAGWLVLLAFAITYLIIKVL